MTKISASILAADAANMGPACRAALQAGADMLHVDVMDGHFVPNISFGVPVLESLRRFLPDAYFDVHLMITDPVRYAPAFAAAGADLLTFHYEAVPDAVPETIAAIRALGCKVGISIKPATPAEALLPYLDAVDLILVMSVEPGFGGQAYRPEAAGRIAALRDACARRGLAPMIEVDGGINDRTARPCVAAGADLLVLGSAFFGAPDQAALAKTLHSL